MTSTTDVVSRAVELLDRIEALIGSSRNIELPEVAAELNVAGTAAALTEQLAQLIRDIRERLQVITALSQLGSLLGLLDPLLGGLRGLFANAGRHVATLGLQDVLSATDATASGFRRLQGTVALGSSLTLAPEQLHGLHQSMSDVVTALDALAGEFRAAEAEG